MMDFENAKQQLMNLIGTSPFSWKLFALAEVEKAQTWEELIRIAKMFDVTFE